MKMMKYLLPWLLICSGVLFGQNAAMSVVLLSSEAQSASVFNGTNQYWTDANPTNIGLNSAEFISNTNTSNFETNIGGWSVIGAGCTIVRSTVDFHAGVASGLVTFTTNGNVSSNFVLIPQAGYSALTIGNKYTLEFWAKSISGSTTLTIYNGITTTNFTITTSWAKYVLNYVSTDGGTSSLRFYFNGATGSLYIDDVSFTQAFDAIIMAAVKKTVDQGSISNILNCGNASSASPAWTLLSRDDNATNNTSLFIHDGTTQKSVSSNTTMNDGLWHLVVGVIDRTGNISLYQDGVSVATPISITAVGKLNNTGSYVIGAVNAGSSQWFQGLIGTNQYIKLLLPADGGVKIITDAFNSFRNKRPFMNNYSNGTVVASYDWKIRGRDISGNGNDLTPVNSPIIIQVK